MNNSKSIIDQTRKDNIHEFQASRHCEGDLDGEVSQLGPSTTSPPRPSIGVCLMEYLDSADHPVVEAVTRTLFPNQRHLIDDMDE